MQTDYLRIFAQICKDSALEECKDELNKRLKDIQNQNESILKQIAMLEKKLEIVDAELYKREMRDWYDQLTVLMKELIGNIKINI